MNIDRVVIPLLEALWNPLEVWGGEAATWYGCQLSERVNMEALFTYLCSA